MGIRVWIIGLMISTVFASVLAYWLSLDAESERGKRIRAEEFRAAEIKARELVEVRARAAEERARTAEDEVAALQRRLTYFAANVASGSAAGAPAPLGSTRVAKHDAAEIARIERLRLECEAHMRSGVRANVIGQQVCAAAYQAIRQRQLYEAQRDGTDITAAPAVPAVQRCNPNVRSC